MIRSPKIFLAFFIISFSLAWSCKSRNESEQTISLREAKQTLRDINKALVDKDRELIEAYIERHKLDGMKDNGSGLFYLIVGDTLSTKVNDGSIVVFSYKVSLLDGSVCYTSQNGKPKEFLVGYGGVESGLEMAVKLMYKGQKGKFILPPHLAHGLLGDNDKIPPRSIIVYDVHLLNVIDK